MLMAQVGQMGRRRPFDPYFPWVKLMLHCDGADASTTFTDTSPVRRGNATVGGNAQVSTSAPHYGTGAALFDGTGDSLYYADSADWHWDAVDYTIELSIKPNATPAADHGLLNQAQASGAHEVTLSLDSARKLRMYSEGSGGSNGTTATTALTIGTWYRGAYSRRGSAGGFHLDGAADGGAAIVIQGDQTSGLYIGRHFYAGAFLSGRDFDGRLDEIRITKGVARYVPGQPAWRSHVFISAG